MRWLLGSDGEFGTRNFIKKLEGWAFVLVLEFSGIVDGAVVGASEGNAGRLLLGMGVGLRV